MKPEKAAPSPTKFAALRAKYLEKTKARNSFKNELEWKYGGRCRSNWLSYVEKSKSERLSAAADKAASAFYDYLTAISPRDWSYGVPTYWLYESLTYEDAIRPANEPLSVVPPLSHGSTVPRA